MDVNTIYKIGDVVYLNSGSPDMTIIDIQNDKIKCQWFENNILKNGEFNIKTIEILTEDDIKNRYSI